MTEDEHRERHKVLHKALDELLADYLTQHREALLSNLNFFHFLQWSYEQTQNPTNINPFDDVPPPEAHSAKPN